MSKQKQEKDIEQMFEENAENFDASTLVDTYIPDLKKRMRTFGHWIKAVKSKGFLLRQVHGIVTKKTLVENPVTGKVDELLMLGSNNYLDLAVEPYVIKRTLEAIEKYGVGCGGPPLLNGYTSMHRELELKLAHSKGCEDSILFSSGYSANLGWVTGLLDKDDYLVYDMQSHGSLFDGMKMGEFQSIPFLHNNAKNLESRLEKLRAREPDANVIVCVEGVYSMDGDISPLDEIKPVCDKYNAMLSIDDAHGTGVMGVGGHGTQEHFNLQGEVDICMGTFSKALTCSGGFVAGSKDMADYLRIYGNSYLYSATIAPSIVGTVLGCLEFIDKNPGRVKLLHENTQYLAKGLRDLGFKAESQSAIIPILIPKEYSMRELVYRFHEEGIFINGIEYPSVPRNKQRLRLSMMATFDKKELDYVLQVFEKVGREYKLID